jgi:glycosyltransferase involved in cell wall biosynthesis
MRILWVKPGGLWPLDRGGRLRSFHTLSELSRRHDVVLLTTHGPEEDPTALPAHLPQCARVVSFPHHAPKRGSVPLARALAASWFSELPVDLWKWRVPALQKEAARIMAAGQVDLCVADFLVALPNVPVGGPVPVVLFEHNVEYVIWQRLAQLERGWRQALLEIEWRKMRRFESRACARVALTLAVSRADRDLLAEHAPGVAIRDVPTGVDTAHFAPNGRPESPAALVFSGSMDWYPNEDAIVYFVESVFPTILREIPEASLTVVGRKPSARLRRVTAHLPVRITGGVDDVRPHVSKGAIYVVPLRVGGGTRLKIFEALAMGKAVVSTTVGAEGLPLTPGEHFVRSDAPLHFAKEVVALIRNEGRREALGRAGRRLMEERYSWPRVVSDFEAQCREVLRCQ